MIMRPLDETSYDEWDQFVAKANGTIFHKAWWYKSWGVDFDIYARRDENGDIEAGMPVFISRYKNLPKALNLLGIKGMVIPPLTPANGPVFKACSKTTRSCKNTYIKHELLSAIESLPQLDFYDFQLWRFCCDVMPFIWNGFETYVYYTYVISAAEVETWQNNMSKKTRHLLKDARREADAEGYLEIETGASFEEMKPPFRETFAAKNFEVCHYSRLPKWWEEVKKRNAGMSYMIRDKEGRPACASIMVWDNHTAYALLNGTLRAIRKDSHINMLLFERMIKDALGMGLDFDFEGSALMGVERFYRGWGGELRPCYRAIKIPSKTVYLGLNAYKYITFHGKRGWVSAA